MSTQTPQGVVAISGLSLMHLEVHSLQSSMAPSPEIVGADI
jgi:hypothetical protein